MEQTKEQKVAELVKQIKEISGMQVEVEVISKKQALFEDMKNKGYVVERHGAKGFQVFLDYERDKSGKLKRLKC